MTLDQLLSKAFNGKAENIVISKNIIMFHLDGVETRINLVSFIDQIYNDHEETTDKLHKAYAEADYECKALSVQLKAKKEENNNLHRLMGQNTETINEAKKAIIDNRFLNFVSEFTQNYESGD